MMGSGHPPVGDRTTGNWHLTFLFWRQKTDKPHSQMLLAVILVKMPSKQSIKIFILNIMMFYHFDPVGTLTKYFVVKLKFT